MISNSLQTPVSNDVKLTDAIYTAVLFPKVSFLSTVSFAVWFFYINKFI